jgi:hypothetical protein
MNELLSQKDREMARVLKKLRAAEVKLAAYERKAKINKYPNQNECGHTLCWEHAISEGTGRAVTCKFPQGWAGGKR